MRLIECGWRDQLKAYCKGESLLIPFMCRELSKIFKKYIYIVKGKALHK